MRLTNILPLLFFTLIIFSCSEDAQEADFNAIADSFKSTNQDSVVFYAQKSLSLNLGDKHDYYSYFLIAESYQRQKNYSLALTNYLESQRLIPKESIFDYYRYATNNNLGKIFKMYSNYELAIKHYRKALDYVEDKNKASLLYNLGNAYTSSGQYEKATKAYLDSKEIAVQQNDELRQARLHHKLGLLYLALDDVESARSYFETIVNYSGNESASYQKYVGKALHNIGEIYLRDHDYQSAIPYFEKALIVKTGPEKFITYMDLGTCFHKTDQSTAAITSFKEAEKLYASVEPYKKYIDLFKHMHRMYRDQGNTEASTAAVESYFAAIDQYDQVKREQITLFSAAEMSHVVSNFNDRLAFQQTLKDYKYLILALALILIAVIIMSIRMLRNYLIAKRKKDKMFNAGEEFFRGVDSLVNDV